MGFRVPETLVHRLRKYRASVYSWGAVVFFNLLAKWKITQVLIFLVVKQSLTIRRKKEDKYLLYFPNKLHNLVV